MASEFERAVIAARRKHLRLTKQAVSRIDTILRRAAREAAARVKHYADKGASDTIGAQHQAALLDDLRRVLDDLKDDYSGLMGVHLLGSAQTSADREAWVMQAALPGLEPDVLDGLKASRTHEVALADGTRAAVQFGLVAGEAVDAVYSRVLADGLTLSERVWKMSRAAQEAIADRVVQAVAQGSSARMLARDVQSYLRDEGAGNARYNAMRLARTEIATAGREGHIRAVTDDNGQLRSHVAALGFRLSASHPKRDICDDWASQDIDGLGPGNYLPEHVPADHPHGLCYTVTVLKARPDLQFVVKEPEVLAAAAPQQRLPPRVAVEPPQAWKGHVDQAQASHLAYVAGLRGMTPTQYKRAVKKHLRTLLRDARLVTNIDADKLEAVIADGRFRTLHETGVSGGWSVPSDRVDVELAVMGVPSTVPVEHRPVYGWVADPKSDEYGRCRQYGELMVVFRRDRMCASTTVSWGGSADMNAWGHLSAGYPMPLGSADHHIVPLAAYGEYADPLLVKSLREVQEQQVVHPIYVEAQFGGPVTVDDIEEVVIPNDQRFNGIMSVLDQRGIKWRQP